MRSASERARALLSGRDAPALGARGPRPRANSFESSYQQTIIGVPRSGDRKGIRAASMEHHILCRACNRVSFVCSSGLHKTSDFSHVEGHSWVTLPMRLLPFFSIFVQSSKDNSSQVTGQYSNFHNTSVKIASVFRSQCTIPCTYSSDSPLQSIVP